MWQWETDEYQPTAGNLEKAAAKLAVSLIWLRTGEGPLPDLRIVPIAGPEKKRRRGAVFVEPPRPSPPLNDMIAEQSMGIGAGPLVLDARIHDWWRLPSGLVTETLRTSHPYLVVLRVLSDSMEPGIKLHDYVLIDQADTTPVDGKIYAIDNGVGMILRRVLIEDAKNFKLRADHDPTQDVIVKRHGVRLVGRCVLAMVLT